jgi:hypothetical protein
VVLCASKSRKQSRESVLTGEMNARIAKKWFYRAGNVLLCRTNASRVVIVPASASHLRVAIWLWNAVVTVFEPLSSARELYVYTQYALPGRQQSILCGNRASCVACISLWSVTIHLSCESFSDRNKIAGGVRSARSYRRYFCLTKHDVAIKLFPVSFK